MSRGPKEPVFGKCPTCGRTIALAAIYNETGQVRNHMPPKELRDKEHAHQYRSGAWFCKGGRTSVLREGWKPPKVIDAARARP